MARGRDAWERLRLARSAGQKLTAQLERVVPLRDAAMWELHGSGVSYRAIAAEAGLTRGRVAQIVRGWASFGG